jgi:hypothetical protein
LRRRIRVDLVQQHLNAQQNLLDRDRGLPAFFFVQNAEADGAGGVDVWVEERRRELALWWFRRVLCRGEQQVS